MSMLALSSPAEAVITFTSTINFTTRDVTLRVGSAGTIDTVTFNVLNGNVAPNPTAIIGVPSGPTTSPAGGTEVNIQADVPWLSAVNVRLNVDSSATLACVGGSGCGSTAIPFTTISWTSANLATGANAGQDIQSGSFNGSANQTLSTIPVSTAILGSNVVMSNVLTFSYSNTTLYPAGQYRGRVVFTASVL
jgi:hypothetical protein